MTSSLFPCVSRDEPVVALIALNIELFPRVSGDFFFNVILVPVAGAREGCMVLGVRSALPPAHSRTEGKQKATTPAPPQVASPQCFQRREALGSFLY